MLGQYAEDKEQAMPLIRDDRVKKNRMGGSATGTDNAKYAKFIQKGTPANEINEITIIICENVAFSPRAATGAGLQFGSKGGHVFLKEYSS